MCSHINGYRRNHKCQFTKVVVGDLNCFVMKLQMLPLGVMSVFVTVLRCHMGLVVLQLLEC